MGKTVPEVLSTARDRSISQYGPTKPAENNVFIFSLRHCFAVDFVLNFIPAYAWICVRSTFQAQKPIPFA